MSNYEKYRRRQKEDSLKMAFMALVGILVYVTTKLLTILLLL